MNPPKFLRPIKGETESGSEKGILVLERRGHSRYIVELPINYSNTDGKKRWGIAADTSEGGLLIYVDEVIEKGSLLRIEIFFPWRSELNMIQAMAKVVWSDSVDKEVWCWYWGEYRYGLAFQTFDEETLDKLNILLKQTAETYRA